MMRSDHALFITVVLVIIVVAISIALPAKDPEVMFFDIGQGDATLVQEGTAQLLVDGGPDAAVLAKLGDVMPFFDRHIEVVVMTHPDLDHFGGLTDVLTRYSIGTVILPGDEDDTDAYRRFADALQRNGAETVIIRAGDAIPLTGRVMAKVLWPVDGFVTNDQNDRSVVVRLAVDSVPLVLLMGDATARVEAELLAREAPVSIPILKAGHHGSRFSTSAAFLDTLAPEIAVVSVGERNRYGHPSPSTLFRLNARDIAVVRTDRLGDIRLQIKDGTFTMEASACKTVLNEPADCRILSAI